MRKILITFFLLLVCTFKLSASNFGGLEYSLGKEREKWSRVSQHLNEERGERRYVLQKEKGKKFEKAKESFELVFYNKPIATNVDNFEEIAKEEFTRITHRGMNVEINILDKTPNSMLLEIHVPDTHQHFLYRFIQDSAEKNVFLKYQNKTTKPIKYYQQRSKWIEILKQAFFK